MTTVAGQTRSAVWHTLVELDWQSRYFSAMAEMYRLRHRRLRFCILTSVPIEAVVLYLATTYPWLVYVGIVIGLLLAALSIWDAISDYAENAAVLRMTAFSCNELKRDIEQLWRRIESHNVDTVEAEAVYEETSARWGAAAQRVHSGTDRKLRNAAIRESNSYLGRRYGAKTTG